VFRSWESRRAAEFRRLHGIQGLPGTAVVIQLMVFGNMGATSGSGVAFTRDPATGENRPYIDFLFNAQGEDVVAGRQSLRNSEKLSQTLPSVYKELLMVSGRLESEFKDMQDFEFTVQEGRLYILQCRRGNRTPWAALQIAVDMVNEGLAEKAAALETLDAYDLSKITRTMVSTQTGSPPLCRGTPASIGVAVGEITLDTKAAKLKEGRPQILVRHDISTDDILGLVACSGILTNSGGRTSHAAVVARQMNKVCVVGCRTLSINLEDRTCAFDGMVMREGDLISLDGNTGNVYAGEAQVSVERPAKLLEIVEEWKSHSAILT
jgi:pyruvate,orthophosphate dikinase